jgi:hypothetical protein
MSTKLGEQRIASISRENHILKMEAADSSETLLSTKLHGVTLQELIWLLFLVTIVNLPDLSSEVTAL